MPPKRRPRGGSNSENWLHYNNQVELTFKAEAKENTLGAVGDSGSDDDRAPILRKKGKRGVDSSSSSESSDTSDSEPEKITKISDDRKINAYEISDDDNDDAAVAPRPVTPPPNIPCIPASGFGRQTVKVSRTMGEKLRYLDYLKKADTPSPARSWSDVVFVNDECGTPTSMHRKMTVKIRTRDGVERFQLNGNENFEEIFNELAKKRNVNMDALSLSFTDPQGNFQTLRSTDTPDSVNLSVASIIDCVIVDASSMMNESFENSENIVNIKIQGSESDSVKQFKVLKNEPLGKIMQQYADFRQLPLCKLKFSFDGDAMTSEQSPDDLDMDDENVVDVQIK